MSNLLLNPEKSPLKEVLDDKLYSKPNLPVWLVMVGSLEVKFSMRVEVS